MKKLNYILKSILLFTILLLSNNTQAQKLLCADYEVNIVDSFKITSSRIFSKNIIQPIDSQNVLIMLDIYTVYYSQYLESPLWIEYVLYKPQKNCSRKGINFHSQPNIHTANNKDFSNNIYDKGHMVPAEDFEDTPEHLSETFSYINCTVQNQYLNRGCWKSLEEYINKLAMFDSLNIYIEIIFTPKSKKLPTGAFIPDGFRKTIHNITKNSKEVYYFPNTECTKNSFEDYLIK